MGTGAPPPQWAALMAEMMVEDYPASLAWAILEFSLGHRAL